MSSFDIDRRGAIALTAAGLASQTALPALGNTDQAACYRIALAGGTLSLYALSDRAFRVRFSRDDRLAPSAVLLPQRPTAQPRRIEMADAVKLELPHIGCTIRKSDSCLSFYDGTGRLLLSEVPNRRVLTASTVQGQSCFAVAQDFVSPPDERLYGTGQFQDGFLNIRGLSRRLTQVNTQISLPFVLSSKGYGLLWHNMGLTELNPPEQTIVPEPVPYRADSATVDVTTTAGGAKLTRDFAAFEGRLQIPQSGRYRFLLDVGQAMASKHYVEIDGVVQVDIASLWLPPTTSFFANLTAGEHHFRIVADGKDHPTLGIAPVRDETALRSPVADGIDYIVIAGPKADSIIADYHHLTGQAPMMPRWAFGYIHCRERYTSSADVLANAQEFRSRKIPMDVMVQDWQYWGRYGWNAMRFDEKDYPDPAGMIRQLHSINARFMLSVWAKADPQSDVGKAFEARGCFIPGTNWIDFFNPKAAACYWTAMSHRLLPLGIDAWWQDATEPENDDLVGRMTAKGPGETVRLQYPLEVNRTVYEGLRRDAPGQRVMILSRSAFLGQQRYGSATWSGDIGCDWETLKRQIPAGLNMMAAGYPYWTVDAGGFFRPGESQYTDPAYHELFLRWLQYATFLPLMRVHGYQSKTEPWRYGADVERRARALIELRYRLLPYIYSHAAEITRSGTMLMRPLVMDFADDPKALDETHSYMFGNAFHVAPVLQPGVSEWNVYLPQTEGGWYDFWTGAHRAGGATYATEAPLDRIPLHVKAGSIIPLGPVVQSTAEADGSAITLHIYPGADGNFTLYEDEGVNYGYEKGRYSTIAIQWRERTRELTLSARQGHYPGMRKNREFGVTLVGGTPDGKPLLVSYTGDSVSLRL